MILHIVGVHNATDHFFGLFKSAFPQKNIAIRIKGVGTDFDVLYDDKEINVGNEIELKRIVDFTSVTVVVVHLFSFTKERFVLRNLSNNVPVIWWIYGGDLYNHFLLKKGYKLYAPQTLPYVNKKKAQSIITKTKYLYSYYLRAIIDKRIIRRVKGIIPCEEPDYSLACWYIGKTVDLVNISPRQNILDYPYANGNDICIGHSASMTNNHLYALDIISKIDIGSSKVVLALSYNIQNEEYRNNVIERYRQVYGDNVKFLMEFQQEEEEYKRSFLNYKVAIFPCWRQEALGNIFTCFQLGVKVYLSKHNPCYSYFIKLGYYVYAIEEIKKREDFEPLSLEEKNTNRKLFIKIKRERDTTSPVILRKYFSQFID